MTPTMKNRLAATLAALIAFAGMAAAQDRAPADTTAVAAQDSVVTIGDIAKAVADKVNGRREKKVHFLNGIAVGADAVGFIMKAMGSDWRHMEVLGRINILDKYFPIAELGIGEADHEGRDIDNRFKVRAPYFRAGADYNFNKKHNGNRMMGGLRYGFAKYNYDFTSPVPLTDPVWGGAEEVQMHDLDGRCHWMEVVFSLETRIWTIVHLGWDIRLKAKLSQKHAPEGEPWYIPGYGKTGSSTAWGGSFKLLFDI